MLSQLSFPAYPRPPYLQHHPNTNNQPYSQILAHMMEFIEISQNIDKDQRPAYIHDNFNPNFYHQEVVKRYMLNNDACIIIHPPGKGKTCTAVDISEYIKAHGTNVEHRPNYPKRTYIFERGPSVISDIKNQIVNVCAKDVYNVEESSSLKGNKRRISNALAKSYTIQTYKSFSAINLPDDLIIETYSDCTFIIDEAHNIVGWNTPTGDEDDEDEESEEVVSQNDIEAAYKYLHRVLHLAKRIKVIIMTATPMTNSADEVIKLFNLVLPMDKQLDSSKINLSTITQSSFNIFAEGLISYVPDIQAHINIKEVGEPLPYYINGTNMSKTIAKRLPMQGLQAKIYNNLEASAKNKPSSFFLNHRKVSGFVMPDGSFSGKKIGGGWGWGGGGKGKYITRVENDKYVASEEFNKQVQTNLPSLSSNFSYVINKELTNNRTISLTDNDNITHNVTLPGKGCSFYYFDLVTAHAIPFTMCLEAFGFERYNDDVPAFTTINGKRHITIEKKRRYIFITKDNVSSKLENFKNLYNSEENVFGEYVQMIVGSRIIKDGINIFNVARLYINPSWNPASMIQAMARAKRLPGHNALIKAIKNLMSQNNFPQHLIDSWKFTMEQHKLSSFIPSIKPTTTPSIDISVDDYFYVDIIEKKSLTINRVFQMMVNASFDKYINGAMPITIDPTMIDYSNFNSRFSAPIINQIEDIITSMFSHENYIYSIDTITQHVYSIISPLLRHENYIYKAIRNIVNNKNIIRDRYNNKMWIHVVGKYIFISDTYPSEESSNLTNAFYHYLIPNEEKNIKDSVKLYAQKNIEELITIPYVYNNTIANIVILEHLILEEIKRNYNNGATTLEWWSPDNEELNPLIRRLLKSSLYVSWKPYHDIKNVSYLLSRPSINKGVKAADDSKIKLKNIIYLPEPTTNTTLNGITLPLIIYHTIDTDCLRILNTVNINNLDWQCAMIHEEPVYTNIIQNRKKDKLNSIPIGKLYGTVKITGEFIINRMIEDDEINIDKRLTAKGKACSSMQRNDLIDMLKEENIDMDYSNEDIVKSTMCVLLRDTLELDGRLFKH